MKNKQRVAAVLTALLLGTPLTQLPNMHAAEAASGRLAAPTNVMFYPDHKVTWTKVNDANGYSISVYDAADDTVVKTEKIYNASTSTYQFSNLVLEDGSYYVRIVALGNHYTTADSLPSSKSNELTLSTRITLSTPEAPTVNEDGTVEWTPATNNGYQLNIYHSPSNTLVMTATIGKDASSTNIASYIPGTGDYYVTLQALGDGETMSSSGESGVSNTQHFTVVKVNAPTAVELSYQKVASWANVQDNNGYRVSVYNAADDSILGFAQAAKDATSLDISHLITQGGNYYVRVQTLGTQNNASPYSEPSTLLRISAEAGVYLLPEQNRSINGGVIDDQSYSIAEVQTAAVLSDLNSDSSLSTIEVEIPVAPGRVALRMDGAIVDSLLSRSAKGVVRLDSAVGMWNLPLQQIADLAQANNVALSGTTVQLILAQEEKTDATLLMAPVRTGLSLLNGEGTTLATMTKASGYNTLTVKYSNDAAPAADKLAGVRLLDGQSGEVAPVPVYFYQDGESPTMMQIHYQGAGTFSVRSDRVTFQDLPYDYYATHSIESLSTKLVINGFGDGTFRPQDSVTRAQFATLLVKALGLDWKYTQAELNPPAPTATTEENTTSDTSTSAETTPTETTDSTDSTESGDTATTTDTDTTDATADDSTTPSTEPQNPFENTTEDTTTATTPSAPTITPTFGDVPVNAWYFNAVETAYETGLINGRSSSVFAPEDKITDQEMATMVTRALQYAGFHQDLTAEQKSLLLTSLPHSSEVADYAVEPVILCLYKEILSGPTASGFNPTDTADRGMAADMLYRMLQVLQFTN
ncbi:MAG TPA: S-layer homology domain-containing protein [Bacilli bacterium]|nr:S-layer homology domain-containing protein [Bacilli bacterium]